MKTILKDIWEAVARANPKNNTACRFQTMLGDTRTEISVSSRSVFYDYAPTEKLELDQYFEVADLPMKELQDPEKVQAENMFYDGSIPLEDNSLLDAYFLNAGLASGHQKELSVFDLNGGTAAYYRMGLPWGRATYFEWVRKIFYTVPEAVQERLQETATLKELNAQIVRLKASPDLALLLGSATSWLLVTMSRTRPMSEVYDHIFIDDKQYRLDGFDREIGAYTRLVEVVDKTMRGLANPTKAAQQAAQAAPTPAPEPVEPPVPEAIPDVPQVEEVQPEQAEEIAAQAPEAVAQQPADPVAQEEETPKRTRTRKAPTAVTPANAKALEEVAAYLGSPVADSMTMEEIDEEIRKCRDLGVALSRRMANLYAAGTLIPKKKLAAVREAMN